MNRHMLAYARREGDVNPLLETGTFHWRSGGESHINDPVSIANVQDAAQNKNQASYNKYVESQNQSVSICMKIAKYCSWKYRYLFIVCFTPSKQGLARIENLPVHKI